MHLTVEEVFKLKNKVIDTIRYDDTDKYYDIKYLNQKIDNGHYNSMLIVDFKNRLIKLIDSIDNGAKFKIKYKNEDQFSDVKEFKFSFSNKNGKMRRYNKKDELDKLREYESGMSFSLNIETKDC